MNCQQCGNENGNDALYCSRCGAATTPTPPPPPPTDPSGPNAQYPGYGYPQAPPPSAGQPYGAQFLPGPYASWGTWALGLLIDGLLTACVIVPIEIVGAVLRSIPLIYLADLAGLVVAVFFALQIGSSGASPGMRIMGLRCVSADTGQTIGGGMGVVRAIACILNTFICYIGWLFPLWDARRQTLADKIVSTVVCSVPRQAFSISPPGG